MTKFLCTESFPDIFDAIRATEAEPGLQVCSLCESKAECLNQVDPANNNFDGIVGGAIWINGKPQRYRIQDPNVIAEYLSTAKVIS